MISSYNSMKNVLSMLNLYSFDSTNIRNELLAYSHALDGVNVGLAELIEECFVDTAYTYGLSNRELLFGALRDDVSYLKRRTMLKGRENITSTYFTLPKIKKALKSFGLECEIIEYPSLYTVVINAIGEYSKNQQAWINSEVLKIMPAHLNVQVIFDGVSWDESDSKNNTFSTIDNLNYTWNTIDNL